MGLKLTRALLKPINTSAIVLLGVYTVAWGFWIGNPFWNEFAIEPSLRVLSSFAPEFIWGLVALIAGAVIVYGVLKPSYENLTRGALCGFIYWVVMATLEFVSNWQSVGGITALLFGLYAAYIYVNIRVNKVRMGLTDIEAAHKFGDED